MDIDNYLAEKHEAEAKTRLEEAKEKLRSERERLKDERRRAKERAREEKSAARSARQGMHGEPSLKPWMLWDLIIISLVLVLFIIAMFFPRSVVIVKKEFTKPIEVKEPIVKTETKVTNKTMVNATPSTAGVNEPGPNFLFTLLDAEGNSIPEPGLIINGTDTFSYQLSLRNLEKSEIKCDGDKTINGVSTKNVQVVKLKAGEKDNIPTSVSASGGVKDYTAEWKFRCHVVGKLSETTMEDSFSVTFEG